MAYLGDYNPNDIIYFNFTTLDISVSPAVPYNSASLAVSIYKDDSATQTTTGVTVTTPHDSVTGLVNVKVDTSADGTFYATGHSFQAIVTVGTVHAVSIVGYVLDSFSLGRTTALKPTTAGRTLDVSATGEAGVDWANVGSPTTTLDLSGTTIKTTQKVDVDTIKTNAVVNGGTITFPTNSTLASTTNITAGTMTTTTNLTNAPPDSSGVTTLLARIGAFTGSGINTVLGFFKAIMKKDAASTPSDVGGTFDNTTDSLEAIKDTGLTVSGSVNVSSMDAGVIGASQITSNAITAAKIATDAIGAAQLASDAVTEIQTGLATPTNITAGTITTVTNLTNAPTSGDLTATMKTSVTTAATAATPTVTTGTISAGAITATAIASNAITAAKVATDAIGAAQLATDAVTEIQTGLATASNLAALTLYASRTVVRGTVSSTSPTTTTFTPSALSPAGVDSNQFKGRILVFDNDTTTTALRGQSTDITANTAASLPLITFTEITRAPVAGDTFSIL